MHQIALHGKKTEFWLVSNFNTDSLPLCGILSLIIGNRDGLAGHRPLMCYVNVNLMTFDMQSNGRRIEIEVVTIAHTKQQDNYRNHSAGSV